MVCNKCGQERFLEVPSSYWCPQCDPRINRIVLSKEDSIKKIDDFINEYKNQFLQICFSYSQPALFEYFSEMWRKIKHTILDKSVKVFFKYSLGFSLLFSMKYPSNKTITSKIITTESKQAIDILLSQIHNYFNFKFHAQKNRLRMVYYDNDEKYNSGYQIKFLEKWEPIKNRMFIQGFLPSDPKTIHDPNMIARRSMFIIPQLLERISETIPNAQEIYDATRFVQFFNFSYASGKYPRRPKKVKRLGKFEEFIKKLVELEKGYYKVEDWNELCKPFKSDSNFRNIMHMNYLSANSNDMNLFPLFVEYGNKVLIPINLLKKWLRMFNLAFIDKKAGNFRRQYGIELENIMFDMLHSLDLKFNDISGNPFIRYKNPAIKENELFDVGCYNERLKKFWIIELKGSLKLNISEDNQFDDLVLKDIDEFKIQDIPAINNNLPILGLNGYTIEPMFMNLAPFLHQNIDVYSDGISDSITLTNHPAEILTKIMLELGKSKMYESIYKTYNIPDNFFSIARNIKVGKLMSQKLISFDIANVLDFISQQSYGIESGLILNIDLDSDPPEFTIILNNGFNFLSIDIHPSLRFAFNEIEKNSEVSVMFYRYKQYSGILILGAIYIYKIKKLYTI